MVTVTKQQVSANSTRSTSRLKRWWRHALYMPWLTERYFKPASLSQIEQAVKSAELGHVGEIVVIIEGSLPLKLAYYLDTRQRALDLFSQYQVWDTEYNSGMLLYVNICEHQVELLADRGIHQFVTPEHWQTICEQVTSQFLQEHYVEGVLTGVQLIGQTLQAFYTARLQEQGNERSNRPILI